jgi:hypothetical protein
MSDDKAHGDGRHERVYVFTHNADYDVTVTGGIPRLIKLGWRTGAVYEKGSVFIEHLTSSGHRSLAILSSTNFYAMPLAKLGAAFKLPKLEVDHETFVPDDTLRTYCRRDTEIVRVAMLFLIDALRDGVDGSGPLGPFRDTVSSVAQGIWRYRFLRHRLFIHDRANVLRLERLSYAGGRTETWFVRPLLTRPLYKLDFHALYLSRQRDGLFPTKVLNRVDDVPVETLAKLVAANEGIVAEVTVDADLPCIPAKRGKTLFPTGRFRVALTTPELRLILRHGRVLHVHQLARYEMAPIFRAFAEFVWTNRVKAVAQGNDALALFWKSVGNNFYGKWGQKSEEWTRVADAPPDEVSHETVLLVGGGQYSQSTYGGGVWRSSGLPKEANNSFPAIAAFVTGYGRAYLWSAMLVAGERHYFMCDTDSLVVDQDGFDRLTQAGLVGDELGQMKVESIVGPVALKLRFPKAKVYAPELPVQFHGAKVYDFGEEHHHKGIPSNSPFVLLPTGENSTRKLVTQWPKFKSALRGGSLDGFANRLVEKTVTVTYDKGLVTESGWVVPWHLSRDEHGEHVDNLPRDPSSGREQRLRWLSETAVPPPSTAERTSSPWPLPPLPEGPLVHPSENETLVSGGFG